jgi:hypothetical protein
VPLNGPLGEITLNLKSTLTDYPTVMDSIPLTVMILEEECVYDIVEVTDAVEDVIYGWGNQPLDVSVTSIVTQAATVPDCNEPIEVLPHYYDDHYDELASDQTVISYQNEIITVERCRAPTSDPSCLHGPTDETYHIVFEVCVGTGSSQHCCLSCLPTLTVQVVNGCADSVLSIDTSPREYTLPEYPTSLHHAPELKIEPVSQSLSQCDYTCFYHTYNIDPRIDYLYKPTTTAAGPAGRLRVRAIDPTLSGHTETFTLTCEGTESGEIITESFDVLFSYGCDEASIPEPSFPTITVPVLQEGSQHISAGSLPTTCQGGFAYSIVDVTPASPSTQTPPLNVFVTGGLVKAHPDEITQQGTWHVTIEACYISAPSVCKTSTTPS